MYLNVYAYCIFIQLENSFNYISRYVHLSGHPSEFENNTALKCKVIGFGATNEFEDMGYEGYITDVVVKFGPHACIDPRG